MSGLGFFYCCWFSTWKKIFLSSFVIWRGEDELMWGQRPEIILENFFFLFYAENGIKQTNCSFRLCLWQKSTCSQWIITCFHPSHSHRVQAVFTPLKNTNSNKTLQMYIQFSCLSSFQWSCFFSLLSCLEKAQRNLAKKILFTCDVNEGILIVWVQSQVCIRLFFFWINFFISHHNNQYF